MCQNEDDNEEATPIWKMILKNAALILVVDDYETNNLNYLPFNLDFPKLILPFKIKLDYLMHLNLRLNS